MAVPPIQRSQQAAAADPTGPSGTVRLSWLSDVVLGLLLVAALPLAIVSIPNVVSMIGRLLPDDIARLDLIRAQGLALPAMILTVPLAALAVRRAKAVPILLAGLILLALADVAGGYAGSTVLVGALRVLRGVGAGLLLPASLAAVWGRPPALRAIWTGMLVTGMVAAQGLALWPIDDAKAWQITLQPYPMASGVALALGAIYLVLWLNQGAPGTPGPEAGQRSRPLLSVVPAVVIGALALGTTFGWSEELVVLAGVVSIVVLLALASIGTFEGAAGRSLAYAMVAVGVVLLPTAAQVTNVELHGLGGPGLTGMWVPFLVAGVAGLLGALLVGRLEAASMGWVSGAGLVTVVLGMAAVRLMVPDADGMLLIVPFVLLVAGSAVALTAALRGVGLGASLFGLSLCFPGVLGGYLLGAGVQMSRLRSVTSAQELADAFVSALHLSALVGGFLVIAVIVLAALLARRGGGRSGEPVGAPDEGPDAETDAARKVPVGVSSEVMAGGGRPGRQKGAGGRERATEEGRATGWGDIRVAGPAEISGESPAVPPPAQSPEDVGTP